MATRTLVPSPDLWGWSAEDRVETETRTERGATYAVQAVYLNGEHVGYVVGRSNWRGAREWDYTTRTDDEPETYGLVYPSTKRQQALAHLVEAVCKS